MSYLYIAQMDIPAEHEALFNRLYDEEHVPQILKVPGCKSCTRFKLDNSSKDGTPKYIAIYEVDSPDVVTSPEWRQAADTGEWKPKIRPHTMNRHHSMYQRIAGPIYAKKK
jgi:hypothetical protein